MMRKRSGALHSDSQEEYIKLAQIAQQHSALFYDEMKPSKERRKRKYAMSLDTQKQSARPQEMQCSKVQPHSNPFESFDFDQQTDNFHRDCKLLAENQRQRSKSTQKTHIVVLSSEQSWKVCQFLRVKLGVSCGIECSNSLNVIDLCVNHTYLPNPDAYFIDCFWVINKTLLSASSNLLSIYLRTCTHLWDITQFQSSPHQRVLEGDCTVLRHSLSKLLQILYEGRTVAHAANS